MYGRVYGTQLGKTPFASFHGPKMRTRALLVFEIKDQKYAPFREYFKQIQQEKYKLALQNGSKLTANSFVEWFLENKADEIQIPYVEQNQKNKLQQLAQQNNREFKKLLHDKA